MEKHFKIVILPYWLEAALAANNLPITAALDLMTLSRILSFRDVCFYTALNNWAYDLLPKPIQSTFYCINLQYDSIKYLMSNAGGNKPSVSESNLFYKRIDSNVGYHYDMINKQTKDGDKKILLSLFPYDTVEDAVQEVGSDYLFNIFDITDDVVGIRFTLPDKHVPYGSQLKGCYNDTLKFLTSHMRFTDVAKTSIFNEFARLGRRYL